MDSCGDAEENREDQIPAEARWGAGSPSVYDGFDTVFCLLASASWIFRLRCPLPLLGLVTSIQSLTGPWTRFSNGLRFSHDLGHHPSPGFGTEGRGFPLAG